MASFGTEVSATNVGASNTRRTSALLLRAIRAVRLWSSAERDHDVKEASEGREAAEEGSPHDWSIGVSC
jgi:hypothetical protein